MRCTAAIVATLALAGCGGKTVIKTTTIVREVTPAPTPTPDRHAAPSYGVVFCRRQITACWQEGREVDPPREGSRCGRARLWYWRPVDVMGAEGITANLGYVMFCDYAD